MQYPLSPVNRKLKSMKEVRQSPFNYNSPRGLSSIIQNASKFKQMLGTWSEEHYTQARSGQAVRTPCFLQNKQVSKHYKPLTV